MTLLAILAAIFGVGASFAMIPQTYKIFKTKSAKDISPSSYSFLATAGFVWVLYGIEIQSYPIILANGVGSTIILFIIFGWFLYGRSEKMKV